MIMADTTDDTRNPRETVYRYLMNCQGMVKVTTGAIIGGIVRHDYVIVSEAPPRVVRELVTNFKMISLTSEGLLIPVTAESTT